MKTQYGISKEGFNRLAQETESMEMVDEFFENSDIELEDLPAWLRAEILKDDRYKVITLDEYLEYDTLDSFIVDYPYDSAEICASVIETEARENGVFIQDCSAKAVERWVSDRYTPGEARPEWL